MRVVTNKAGGTRSRYGESGPKKTSGFTRQREDRGRRDGNRQAALFIVTAVQQ